MLSRQQATTWTKSRSWAEIMLDRTRKWDEERRARLRAELDAIYAHLYGLTKEELDYILETFPHSEEEGYREVWQLQDERTHLKVLQRVFR